MGTFRVLVSGSRKWVDEASVIRGLQFAQKTARSADPAVQMVLVHGDCPNSADRVAARLAQQAGWALEPHPAVWRPFPDPKRVDKGAGYKRNAEMVALGADITLVFQLERSAGTEHCAIRSVRAGIPTFLVAYREGVLMPTMHVTAENVNVAFPPKPQTVTGGLAAKDPVGCEFTWPDGEHCGLPVGHAGEHDRSLFDGQPESPMCDECGTEAHHGHLIGCSRIVPKPEPRVYYDTQASVVRCGECNGPDGKHGTKCPTRLVSA